MAVGEDRPTHEPIEQLASLRALPGLCTIRPAEGNETAAAWKLALESQDESTALVLTRQDLLTLVDAETVYEGVKKGAYVISEAKGEAAVDLALLAGGEPAGVICEILKDDGTMARVPDLFTLAERFHLKMITIKDLAAFRRRYESLCVTE